MSRAAIMACAILISRVYADMQALPPHPGRIMLNQDRLDTIHSLLQTGDPVASIHCNATFHGAVQLLSESVLPWPGIHGDGGMLGAARNIEARLQQLSLSARILQSFESGNGPYPDCIQPYTIEANSTSFARRAVAEAMNAGSYPTWNPGH